MQLSSAFEYFSISNSSVRQMVTQCVRFKWEEAKYLEQYERYEINDWDRSSSTFGGWYYADIYFTWTWFWNTPWISGSFFQGYIFIIIAYSCSRNVKLDANVTWKIVKQLSQPFSNHAASLH